MGFFDRAASEIAYFTGSLRALGRTKPIGRHLNFTIRDLAEGLAQKFGDRPALVSDRESLTYRQWNGQANRYARWARGRGLAKGDVVALLMPNRPEYMAVWLGVAKAGGATALLNTNLSGNSLAHCIKVVGAKTIIVDAAMVDNLKTALPFLNTETAVFQHGAGDAFTRIDTALQGFSDTDLPEAERVALTVNDPCVFIYTSGTTGLPKAANFNHYRILLAMNGFSGAMNAKAGDRMYDCLPMYHTVGGVTATGSVLTVGGVVFIREKFSAREFWSDIVKHQCTMFAYIGELCRYLLHTPEGPNDRAHSIRLCVGNGLRPDIWEAFRDRFGLKTILEFYASTEGNVSMFNFDSKPGAVGRVPKWAEKKFVFRVLKFDVEKEEPVRGPDGLCVVCADGEAGEVVGEIVIDPARPSARFEGYADKAATTKKILSDVLKKGDQWFRTGDLMKRDGLGYYYFIDRIGDTFRWKGENVSTTEVSEAITSFPGVNDATVYGVAVPGYEGRAGMVSLVTDDPAHFDLAGFRAHLASRLPDYARPLLVRFQSQLDVTGTFKQRKVELVAQGFDPVQNRDPLYFSDSAAGAFTRLDARLYQAITQGTMRL